MRIVPSSIREAKAFVRDHHRHLPTVTGGVLAIAIEHDGRIVGVGILARPSSRVLDEDRFTAEATRVCTSSEGAVSKLNSRLKRIWQLQGGVRFKTYTLASESGASLRGAGATVDKLVKARRRSCPSRPRPEREIEQQDKRRWDFGELPVVPA